MHANITKTRIARGSVSPDWATWGERLAQALEQLNEDEYLIISSKRGNRYAYAKGRIFSTLDIPAACSDEQLAEYFRLCEKLGNAMSASFKAQFGGTPPLPRPAASAAIH